MDEIDDLDARLRKSVLRLRAWRWMSRITENPNEVAALLSTEARFLIDLGREHPSRAKEIGRLIVAYHNMIVLMQRAGRNQACPHGRTEAAA